MRSHVSVLGSSNSCSPYQQLLAPISCWERCHGEPRLMFQPPSSRSSSKGCGDVLTPRPKPGVFSSLWEILASEPSGDGFVLSPAGLLRRFYFCGYEALVSLWAGWRRVAQGKAENLCSSGSLSPSCLPGMPGCPACCLSCLPTQGLVLLTPAPAHSLLHGGPERQEFTQTGKGGARTRGNGFKLKEGRLN